MGTLPNETYWLRKLEWERNKLVSVIAMQTDAKNFYTIVIVFVLMAMTCTSLGYFVGRLQGEEHIYKNNFHSNVIHVAAVLKNDARFRNVEISPIRDGDHVMLDGHVETISDWHELKRRVVEAIGKERGEYAVGSVVHP